MKAVKTLIAAVLLCASTTVVSAQTGVASGTPYGSGEDSIRCLQNISLFTSYIKGGSMKDAVEFWQKAYEECPGSSKNIYLYGARIYKWQLEQETDPAKRSQIVDKLMQLYDNRVKYFGEDPKYGIDWIASARVSDYIALMGEQVDYNKIYDWTKPVVDKLQNSTDPQAVYYFVFASLNKAIKDKAWHEQYIQDFVKGNNILEAQLETADEEQQKQILAMKEPMEALFAKSGLASCEMMDKIYGTRLEENKSNAEFLNGMLGMMSISGCESSPLYLKGSKYLFQIKPSAEAAMGLAKESLDNKNPSEAINYLQQAIGLAKTAKMRASCNYTIGVIYMNQRSYGQARQFFNKAIAEDSTMGEAMLNIGQMIASSASNIFPEDRLKQRCVYYLAIEKLERARQMNPQVAGKAASLIGQYRQYLPSAADIFMHPELEKGKSLYIGGWVGESVVIR
ncbi:MAG: tetratricopeptide repeat protein [Porphyromonas sp.]|nr:tetratricopeptide repeat protein [Porphyromonas sp.]